MKIPFPWVVAAMMTAQPICAMVPKAVSVPIAQANQYHDGIAIDEYWQSEKLDGIRAIWDGRRLTTRQGHPIQAPGWFTDPLPDYPVEGELWAGRGRFALVQQTVLDHTPSDDAWRKLRFMLFDLPGAEGHYARRYARLMAFVLNASATHIHYIEQQPIASEQALLRDLQRLTDENGEGIMLRRVASDYQAGRSDDLLKLKKYQDAEAIVIGYKAGKGKYQGMVGSLWVRNDRGVTFFVGSGLSDQQRRDPPALGSVITYRYNGLTDEGKPRFARFVRIRVLY